MAATTPHCSATTHSLDINNLAQRPAGTGFYLTSRWVRLTAEVLHVLAAETGGSSSKMEAREAGYNAVYKVVRLSVRIVSRSIGVT